MESRNFGEVECFSGLCDKILHGGEHTVTEVVFVDGVREVGVPSLSFCETFFSENNTFFLVWMSVHCRDVFWVIVEIASPVGPPDIVEKNDREALLFFCFFLNEKELMVDGVPIMVSINENHVVRFDAIEGIEAEIPIERKMFPVGLLHLFNIAMWFRVNGVEDDVGLFAVLEKFFCMESLINANFDDHARTDDCERRMDNALEEAVHGGVA